MKLMLACLLALSATLLLALGPPAHGVLLSWTQSGTAGVTANTLYCGTATGNYTFKWNLAAQTSFDWLTSDATNPPIQGQKYFCAVTATAGGIESAFSNEVSFTFPQVPLAPSGLSAAAH